MVCERELYISSYQCGIMSLCMLLCTVAVLTAHACTAVIGALFCPVDGIEKQQVVFASCSRQYLFAATSECDVMSCHVMVIAAYCRRFE